MMNPPDAERNHCGARWAKSFAGLTTLAAMFVASVAMHSASIATTSTTGFLKLAQHIDRVPESFSP